MKVNLLALRPTQMALGMKEVELRVRDISKMTRRERDRYLARHRIPVVLGPGGRLYLVDHHHLIRACWEAGHLKVPVEVKADLRKKPLAVFWSSLRKARWIHLMDQFGGGPHDPLQLPQDIKGLADDPFRSLAWMARERGGYKKTELPFAEFLWADFFRWHMKLHPGFHGLKASLEEALRLCRSGRAGRLPGYHPKPRRR